MRRKYLFLPRPYFTVARSCLPVARLPSFLPRRFLLSLVPFFFFLSGLDCGAAFNVAEVVPASGSEGLGRAFGHEGVFWSMDGLEFLVDDSHGEEFTLRFSFRSGVIRFGQAS